ncbi:TcuB: works with TcuA to oxidize tricarballylate to cis-aconitate [Caballeronia glathei]|uniref:Tricarballylate utilization protein B n=1 Tax=Caballeronia glathei TaxID=60547 RepID=A0A069PQL4_9BURK|nr:tricarballylate utilization 4Fe-4S protein TcuB [Caballeronia glathei]KDR42134.1 tricarballylate utilization protein B [Caballeronia glathei]CDY76882.1 TcuB: works with TcuA to oxidize tricarballylate to cis-aconitate [Caballeronia glathei]
MQSLEALTREASALASNEITVVSAMTAAEGEVSRIMQICNACRYCEGFCAVFPAMTRRLEFGRADAHFLANLCHNCGACLHSCQYAPPHEFAVNVPKAMAEVRRQTYVDYAWPAGFGALYKRNGLTIAVALAGGLALFLILATAMKGSLFLPPLAGNFYAVFPHNTLALLFGAVFLFSMIALGVGVRRFWRNEDPGAMSGAAIGEAAHDVLSLHYLGGGHGEGCNNASDAFSLARRRFHHLTFYGFMLCFASTCVATLYHYLLKLEAPYALASLPVVLGAAGGIGLLAGPAGLLWLNLKRHPQHGDVAQRPMDRGFIALLLLTSASGLALLMLRDTSMMALLLAVHLGIVMALFLTLPYGKFAHGIYRSAALLKWAVEKRRPSGLLVED